MRKIIVALFVVLVALAQANAAKPKRTDIPSSDPDKGLFVGTASTKKPFTMYRQALAGAIVAYDSYLRYSNQGQSQQTDSKQFSLKIVNSYVMDDSFILVVEIKPGTDYSYSVTFDSVIDTIKFVEDEYIVTETNSQYSYKVNINSAEVNDVLSYDYERHTKTKELKN